MVNSIIIHGKKEKNIKKRRRGRTSIAITSQKRRNMEHVAWFIEIMENAPLKHMPSNSLNIIKSLKSTATHANKYIPTFESL